MFILTSNENIVQAISETLNLDDFDIINNTNDEIEINKNDEEQPNFLLDINVYLAGWNISHIYQNQQIPEYITKENVFGTEKYMFTLENGFSQNPNWVKPNLTYEELEERLNFVLTLLTQEQLATYEAEFPEDD